ncbi:hypothetical protein [Bacillus sp. FJAT-26390]|uniref:hypothetical protein n=1 Tax=Bacillus sp. FJAT-26390 TaxID=1743142 RepID=UPI00159EF1C8|nr:hypothetical protein [Bacillus sp. FJAT-26390]
MDMSKATRAQLVIIQYDDPLASKSDRTDAENELKRREKRRSGKPNKHPGSKR